MKTDEGELIELIISDVKTGPMEDGYHPIRLETSRGHIDCRYYPAKGTNKAAIWVGGVGGGWDTPAHELYPTLSKELTGDGIASLRVRFRRPTELQESVLDVLAGVAYLQRDGIELVALIGHSFGGPVVIHAAAACRCARTVVTLATQSYGTAPVSELGPRCSILLIHGTLDEALSPSNSETVYSRAKEPKRLILYEGAHHGLDEVAEQVHEVVRDWIVDELNKPVS